MNNEEMAKMNNEEIADKLMGMANITSDDVKNITSANDAFFQDFLNKPEKGLFSRMAVADLSMRAIVKRIKEMGPDKMYEEAKKSDFAGFIIKVIGVYAMLGTKMGYVEKD